MLTGWRLLFLLVQNVGKVDLDVFLNNLGYFARPFLLWIDSLFGW